MHYFNRLIRLPGFEEEDTDDDLVIYPELEELNARDGAENLYVAMLVIRGFSSVFPYALYPLRNIVNEGTALDVSFSR